MFILNVISEAILPVVVVWIVLYGLCRKQCVYEDFLDGAKEGFHITIEILPTLVGLMCGVGILRASGFLTDLANVLGCFIPEKIFPSALVPVALVKMFSSSAATGLVLDIFKQYGTDSFLGVCVSIMGSCTETIFYTMSVYFMSVKVRKTRWTLPGALFATAVGLIVSLVLARWMC